MKYLVLLLVLGVAYMVWRGQRLAARKDPDKPGQGGTQAMQRLHLPASTT